MIVPLQGEQGELTAVNSHTGALGQHPDKKTDRLTHTGTLRIKQNSHTVVPLIYSD